MDFQYGSEHFALRSSLRGFLDDTAPMPRVRDIAAANGHDDAVWRRICTELEVPGLHVPEKWGGSGATLVETAIAFEEVGHSLTPVPLAATTFAIEAVLRLGDDRQRATLLPGLLRGQQVGTLAAAGADITDPVSATVHAQTRAGIVELSGYCMPVLHGHVADVFVVPAVRDGEVALYVVQTGDPGVTVEPLPSFDTTRPVASLRLDATPAQQLAAAEPGGIELTLDVARVLLAAEMLGGAQACLQMAVEYACCREQFDRPIGSFQAVKHACAEMMIEIDATRAAVMFASMCAGDPAELRIAAPLAKAQAADTFTSCAGAAFQVHGGIAFTWEHDLHLYLRRAKTTAALFGGIAYHRALLADRVGL